MTGWKRTSAAIEESTRSGINTFSKSRRAQSVDDYETWVERDFTNTLNVFDNATSTRATELVVFPIQDGRELSNKNQNGKGYGEEDSPSYTLDTTGAQGVAWVMRERAGKPGGGKGVLISDKAFTLATSNFHTVFPGDLTVRRLTPLECERLQGFPDNWTEFRFDEKSQTVIKQTDSARYKQMGNAVTVSVASYILQRLADSFKNGN